LSLQADTLVRTARQAALNALLLQLIVCSVQQTAKIIRLSVTVLTVSSSMQLRKYASSVRISALHAALQVLLA
jgi:hypothetical protein